MTTIPNGPFGATSLSLTLWDPVSQRNVQTNAAEFLEYKVKAAFMDFLIEADPHIKEMWIVFNTKERILK